MSTTTRTTLDGPISPRSQLVMVGYTEIGAPYYPEPVEYGLTSYSWNKLKAIRNSLGEWTGVDASEVESDFGITRTLWQDGYNVDAKRIGVERLPKSTQTTLPDGQTFYEIDSVKVYGKQKGTTPIFLKGTGVFSWEIRFRYYENFPPNPNYTNTGISSVQSGSVSITFDGTPDGVFGNTTIGTPPQYSSGIEYSYLKCTSFTYDDSQENIFQ